MRHTHGGSEHSHDGSGSDHSHDTVDLSESSPLALDLTVPDSELSPSELGRRSFLRRAGLVGATAAAASVFAEASPAAALGSAASAPPPPMGTYRWLAGDHHIHTQHSSDAQYRVADQVQHGSAFGLDWMVITDHGSL
ncbi:MAG: hypothetical protein ABI890_01055, partial [Lapillicoccus sp.]